MTVRRMTIAIPEELLRAIDRAARESGESRSKFINRVLAEALKTRANAEITRRLDVRLADEEARKRKDSTAADSDAAGTD